jgi:hypothetical protein
MTVVEEDVAVLQTAVSLVETDVAATVAGVSLLAADMISAQADRAVLHANVHSGLEMVLDDVASLEAVLYANNSFLQDQVDGLRLELAVCEATVGATSRHCFTTTRACRCGSMSWRQTRPATPRQWRSLPLRNRPPSTSCCATSRSSALC